MAYQEGTWSSVTTFLIYIISNYLLMAARVLQKSCFHTHNKPLAFVPVAFHLPFSITVFLPRPPHPTSPLPSRLILFCLLASCLSLWKISGFPVHLHLWDSLFSPHLPLFLTSWKNFNMPFGTYCLPAANLPICSTSLLNGEDESPSSFIESWLFPKDTA